MSRRESGAALAVTLVLMSGLGALALTGAAAAVTALALAGHQQAAQQAFEAAEAGNAQGLALAAETRAAGAIAEAPHPGGAGATSTFAARIDAVNAPGALPAGFSVGEHAAAFGAQHFVVVSEGRSARNALVRIEQGFYLVVPGAGP